MLTSLDLNQIQSKGIDLKTLEKQIENFVHGFPFICLDRPAVKSDGILVFQDEDMAFYIGNFENKIAATRVIKFVPASGAASRMFKHIFEFREQFVLKKESLQSLLGDKGFNSVYNFFGQLEKFPFYEELRATLKRDAILLEDALSKNELDIIIDYLLEEKGLNYSNLPKALVKFHNYPDGARVAAEEHLVEAALYATDHNREASVHFTLSAEHIEKFLARIEEILDKYQSLYNVNFNISYSIQKPSTDTIAVDEANKPFRNPDGTLHFRPGGHGALLSNLNDIDADIIFVKNIDNIVPDRLKGPTVKYKKLIGGFLLWVREIIFDFLDKSDQGSLTETEITSMATFIKKKLMISLPDGFDRFTWPEKESVLKAALNRPIRVCGMVKNEGEPGGGPFWIKEPSGRISLQIVESSQVNMNDAQQEKIFDSSTHFNPVDLVCCIKDHTGRIFNLADFVDESTGFISLKSSGGKTLKAQELPGLWNGAMANWITIFVEVPIITFNPVKTVNDLLREEHQ